MDFIFISLLNYFSLLSLSQKDFPNRTYPTSCCESAITDQISISHKPLASAVVFRTDDDLREHHSNISELADAAWNHVIPRSGGGSGGALDSTAGAILTSESKIIASCRAVYTEVF